MNPNLQLPQFTPYAIKTGDCTKDNFHEEDSGNFTCIRLDLYLKRNIGYYMIQMYIPSGLVVMLSWLSFWLHVEAVPARVTLGILTVLTMTTQRSMANTSLARVSYVKAMDVWMATCLCFVFCALLEYAFVNVISRQKTKRRCNDDLEKMDTETTRNGLVHVARKRRPFTFRQIFPQTAHTVDNISKITFPVVFLAFCILYWLYYMVTVD